MLDPFIKNVIILLIVILASLGGTFLIVKMVQGWTAVEREAKDFNKRIELTNLFISLVALVLSIVAIYISLTK